LPPPYRWTRYRLEGEAASKRRFSGQASWWFGGFYDRSLDEIELSGSWNPSLLVTFTRSAERNVGPLRGGDFAQTVVGGRTTFNLSADLQLNSLVQYDDVCPTWPSAPRPYLISCGMYSMRFLCFAGSHFGHISWPEL
jgi:hypothetical protein